MVESRKFLLRFINPFFVSLTYLFLYLPIVVLVLFSFNDDKFSIKWVGFSLRWYKKMINTPEVLSAVKTSLIVAIVTTFLSVFIGTCFVVASKWWRSRFLQYIFYGNILFPEIILAIGVFSVFSYFRLPLGYGSLIVGHTVLGLGFVIPIVKARFVELDPLLTEASLDLGASYFQTFYKVIIPLLMPALIASGLLVFTLSLDDFLISLFCSGTTITTLSVYVYSMIRAGIDPMINAVSTCLLVVSSILALLVCSLKVVDRIISHE